MSIHVSGYTQITLPNGRQWGINHAGNNLEIVIPPDSIPELTDADLVQHIRAAALRATELFARQLLSDPTQPLINAPSAMLDSWDKRIAPFAGQAAAIDATAAIIQKERSNPQRTSDDRGRNNDPAGYVYLAHAETGQFKIGRSREPAGRIRHFDTIMPVKVETIHVIDADNMEAAESALHTRFADKRIAGEWFLLTPGDVQEIKQLRAYVQGEWQL